MTVSADGTLDVGLLPAQLRMLSYATAWAGVRGGKGAGKSAGIAYWVLMRLVDFPLANHVVAGADYQQLRNGFFRTFTGVLAKIGWQEGVDYSYRDSPTPLVTFANGAKLRSVSAKIAHRLNSIEFQTMVLEEPQTWGDRGYDAYGTLETRRRHSMASSAAYGPTLTCQGRMSFNPPRVGHWLHKLVTEVWPLEGWPCDKVSLRDNYLLQGLDAYIRQIKAAFPPSAWPSEIDGEWSTITGGAHREFDRSVHCDPPPGITRGVDPNLPLIWGLDFNVGRMRSLIAQTQTQEYVAADGVAYISPESRRLRNPEWQKRILRYVGEIALDEGGTLAVVRAFVARYGDHARRTGVALVGDSSGGARSQIDGVSTNWSTIEAELDRAGIGYTNAVTHNGSPYNRIMTLEACFRSGDGFGCTIDADECPHFLDDIEQVQWDRAGTDYDKKSAKLSHAADAGGYLAVHFKSSAELFAFYV